MVPLTQIRKALLTDYWHLNEASCHSPSDLPDLAISDIITSTRPGKPPPLMRKINWPALFGAGASKYLCRAKTLFFFSSSLYRYKACHEPLLKERAPGLLLLVMLSRNLPLSLIVVEVCMFLQGERGTVLECTSKQKNGRNPLRPLFLNVECTNASLASW